MIEKKDWETALKQFEALQVNNSLNAELDGVVVDYCKKKIGEFPEEKDEAPEDIKEVLNITK